MNPSMRVLHALRQQRSDWPVSLFQVTQTLQHIEEAADPVIEEFADLVVTAQPGRTRVWPLREFEAGAAGLYDFPA